MRDEGGVPSTPIIDRDQIPVDTILRPPVQGPRPDGERDHPRGAQPEKERNRQRSDHTQTPTAARSTSPIPTRTR